MGMVIDSVASIGLVLLGKVDDYLAGNLPAFFIDGQPLPQPVATDTKGQRNDEQRSAD
jgi:hypothetical protein